MPPVFSSNASLQASPVPIPNEISSNAMGDHGDGGENEGGGDGGGGLRHQIFLGKKFSPVDKVWDMLRTNGLQFWDARVR